MKLYYRGISYEYNAKEAGKKAIQPFAPVRREDCAYNLTYRGLTYRVDPNIKPAKVSTPSVTYQLIYRGIAYLVKRTHTEEVFGVSQPVKPSKIGKFLMNNLGLQK